MPEHPPRPWLRPEHLLLIGDVRRLCKVAPGSRHTIPRWRRDKGFPGPVRSIRTGRGKKANRIEIWDRREVVAWLRENPPVSNLIKPAEESRRAPGQPPGA